MYCNFTENQLRWLQTNRLCVDARIDQWNHFPTIRTPNGEVSWIGSFEALADYLAKQPGIATSSPLTTKHEG